MGGTTSHPSPLSALNRKDHELIIKIEAFGRRWRSAYDKLFVSNGPGEIEIQWPWVVGKLRKGVCQFCDDGSKDANSAIFIATKNESAWTEIHSPYLDPSQWTIHQNKQPHDPTKKPMFLSMGLPEFTIVGGVLKPVRRIKVGKELR